MVGFGIDIGCMEGGGSCLRWIVEEAVAVGADVPFAERAHPERFDLDGVVGC
jgi:hypothetical protein